MSELRHSRRFIRTSDSCGSRGPEYRFSRETCPRWGEEREVSSYLLIRRTLTFVTRARQVGHLLLSRLGFWRNDTSHLGSDRATENGIRGSVFIRFLRRTSLIIVFLSTRRYLLSAFMIVCKLKCVSPVCYWTGIEDNAFFFLFFAWSDTIGNRIWGI